MNNDELKKNWRRKEKMTDEQIEAALNICTFGYLREKQCKVCPLDSGKEPCMTNLHLATLEYIKRLKAENAALRERLEKAVEFPFKLGEKIWHIEYEQETEFDDAFAFDITRRIFIGGNEKYAFLSPQIFDGQERKEVDSLCEYYYREYKRFDDNCDCIVIPYSECFSTKQEAEARLAKLNGGK